jgi:hypothetical protein
MNMLIDHRDAGGTASKSANGFASTDIRVLYTRISATVDRYYKNIPARAQFWARRGSAIPTLASSLNC